MPLTETELKHIEQEAISYCNKNHSGSDKVYKAAYISYVTAVTKEREKAKVLLDALRKSFSKYVKTEGCSCCQDEVPHSIAAAEIGELLGFEKYKDGSGYNFYELPINNTTNEQ